MMITLTVMLLLGNLAVESQITTTNLGFSTEYYYVRNKVWWI